MFIQIHGLTFVPPANLNRDDTGRPKTAMVGGAPRLRLSSQALKRAWRMSPEFQASLTGHLGERTRRIGDVVLARLLRDGMAEKRALETTREIVSVFGKLQKDGTTLETLAFISPEERAAVLALADRALAGEKLEVKGCKVLQTADTAVDIALFGRMLTDDKGAGARRVEFSREAAVQVAHAITTHKVVVEDDYWTAVDDLSPAEETGAGHLGEAGFGSGVFYQYLCIDRGQLVRNLDGDEELADLGIGALVRAVATVLPGGKQNSFAALGRAGYVMVERGKQQPRTFAGAFARPVGGTDLMADSVIALRKFRGALETAYGDATASMEMEVGSEGSLADVILFAQGVPRACGDGPVILFAQGRG